MTLLVVRLRLAMTRSTLHLASSVVGGLAAVLVLGTLGPGLVLLVGRPLRVVALTVPLFAVITLMWAVLSLIGTGVDSTLDPARFSVLPVRADELARGLLAAALTGIPAVLLSAWPWPRWAPGRRGRPRPRQPSWRRCSGCRPRCSSRASSRARWRGS